MFLLDTNVVSELRKVGSNRVDCQVEKWAKSTPGAQTFISTITIFELECGVLLRERRDRMQGSILRQWLNDRVLAEYAERIIPIDIPIARRCSSLHVPDPMPDYDAMIAATALEHCLTIVTRNTKDFERTGVKLLNPWTVNSKS
jgi:toxin FitB